MPKLLELVPSKKSVTIFDTINHVSFPEALKIVLTTFSEALAPKQPLHSPSSVLRESEGESR